MLNLFTSHSWFFIIISENMTSVKINPSKELKAYGLSVTDILHDYKIGYASRQASLIGRKEVFLGRAKFGIFGDGKELAQLAMARFFREGDHRSGYYRDQTFMFAANMLTAAINSKANTIICVLRLMIVLLNFITLACERPTGKSDSMGMIQRV